MVWSTEWTKICSVQRRIPPQLRGAAPGHHACMPVCAGLPKVSRPPNLIGAISPFSGKAHVRGKAAGIVWRPGFVYGRRSRWKGNKFHLRKVAAAGQTLLMIPPEVAKLACDNAGR